MSDFSPQEKILLNAVLDSADPRFVILRAQVAFAVVKKRSRPCGGLVLDIKTDRNEAEPLTGAEADIDIADTRIRQLIKPPAHVWLTVLDGLIYRLQVSGLESETLLDNYIDCFWVKRGSDDESLVTTHDAADRDIEAAISYHPMYK